MRITSLIVAATIAFTAPAVSADDETYQSAEWLLKKATLVHRDGLHNILLRALRQMKEPGLKPLFSELTQRRHPSLQAHGVLGLGELADPAMVDMALIANLTDTATQAQVVSAALDSDLMSLDQARQIITWPALDNAVKVIVASVLLEHGALGDHAFLNEAMTAPDANDALRGSAALLLLQLGEPGAIDVLRAIASDAEQSDVRRENMTIMFLQAANRHGFTAAGPWALEVADDAGSSRNLRLVALGTAIRLDAPGAADRWQSAFDAATGAAERIRLAVLGLDVSDQLTPPYFEHLRRDQSDLIRAIGELGRAAAAGDDTTAPAVALLKMNHVLGSNWVLKHARALPIERGTPILEAIIRDAEAEPNPQRNRGRRLEYVVLAAEHLAQESTDARPLFDRLFAAVPELTQEAMLMGLIRADRDARPHRLIANVRSWPSNTAESLALILAAKNGVPLDDEQLEKLALIVRGGGGLQDPLRVQAAWVYLRLTEQDGVALSSVLSR